MSRMTRPLPQFSHVAMATAFCQKTHVVNFVERLKTSHAARAVPLSARLHNPRDVPPVRRAHPGQEKTTESKEEDVQSPRSFEVRHLVLMSCHPSGFRGKVKGLCVIFNLSPGSDLFSIRECLFPPLAPECMNSTHT